MSEARCVLIIDPQLAPGKVANAAAVMALTVGQRHPQLVGEPLVDASESRWPGLIPTGIPVLSADVAQLNALMNRAVAEQFDVVIFPREGQQTTDYPAFMAAVAQIPGAELQLLGLAVTGEKSALRKFTRGLTLFS